MGCDCKNTFPPNTKKKDVVEFLRLLGYEYINKDEFHFFRDDDTFYTGILAYLGDFNGSIEVGTHTTVWRSKADSDYHNFTINQLKKRFGGYFYSDNGKNRYLKPPRVERIKSELGCYAAFHNFRANTAKAFIYLDSKSGRLDENVSAETIKNIPFMALMHPTTIANNIIIPYFVSCLEEYFKNTYIALLKYSDRKLPILKNARILPDDLYSISMGELSVEEAITKTMSFQNISKICLYFKDVNTKLDLAGVLKKPEKKQKKSLYEILNGILEQRHLLVHKNVMMIDYSSENAKKDLHNIDSAIEKVYDKIIDVHGWHKNRYE